MEERREFVEICPWGSLCLPYRRDWGGRTSPTLGAAALCAVLGAVRTRGVLLEGSKLGPWYHPSCGAYLRAIKIHLNMRIYIYTYS